MRIPYSLLGGGVFAIVLLLVLVAFAPPMVNYPANGLAHQGVLNVGYENVTLPGWSFGGPNLHTPVLSKWGPDRQLTAYYVAQGAVYSYVMATGQLSFLNSWLPLGVVNTGGGSINGDLSGYQDAKGNLTILWDAGLWGGWLYTQQYDLFNGTYLLENTSLKVSLFDSTVAPYGGGGWWYFLNTTTLVLWQSFSPPRWYVATFPPAGPPSDWNTATYIPGVNQVIEDLNAPNGAVEVYAFQFSLTGYHSIGIFRFFSKSEPFIVGQDENNEPYFYKENPNGSVLLWGVGDNGVNIPSFHLLEALLFPDETFDRVLSVSSTNASGDTEIANGPVRTNGLWPGGYDAFAPDQGKYQVPLENLLTGTAYETNSSWLNAYFHTHAWGWLGTTDHVGSSMEYIGTTGDESAVPGPGGILVYWLGGTNPFVGSPQH